MTNIKFDALQQHWCESSKYLFLLGDLKNDISLPLIF